MLTICDCLFSSSVLFKVDSHPVWVRAKEKFEEKVAEVLKRNVKKEVELWTHPFEKLGHKVFVTLVGC